MAQFIDKDALVAKIERLKNTSLEYGYNTIQKVLADSGKDLSLGQLQYFLDTLEVKDVDLESYNKLKRTLSLSFMNFLDSNRREGKMCLSNGECYDIDKAFDELDFAKLFRYMEKYLKAPKVE